MVTSYWKSWFFFFGFEQVYSKIFWWWQIYGFSNFVLVGLIYLKKNPKKINRSTSYSAYSNEKKICQHSNESLSFVFRVGTNEQKCRSNCRWWIPSLNYLATINLLIIFSICHKKISSQNIFLKFSLHQ